MATELTTIACLRNLSVRYGLPETGGNPVALRLALAPQLRGIAMLFLDFRIATEHRLARPG